MEKLQSQLTFFLWNRNVLGWIHVAKRMMFALTASQILEGTPKTALIFLAIREGLSAITDYASASNPINSVQQSAPPNPQPLVTDEKPV